MCGVQRSGTDHTSIDGEDEWATMTCPRNSGPSRQGHKDGSPSAGPVSVQVPRGLVPFGWYPLLSTLPSLLPSTPPPPSLYSAHATCILFCIPLSPLLWSCICFIFRYLAIETHDRNLLRIGRGRTLSVWRCEYEGRNGSRAKDRRVTRSAGRPWFTPGVLMSTPSFFLSTLIFNSYGKNVISL